MFSKQSSAIVSAILSFCSYSLSENVQSNVSYSITSKFDETYVEILGNSTLSDSYEEENPKETQTVPRPLGSSIEIPEHDNFLTDDEDFETDNTTFKKDDERNIRRRTVIFNWDSYYRLATIYNWIKDKAKENPTLLFYKSIGKTAQGREIFAVQFQNNTVMKRPKVIIEGGVHGDEWMSPAFVTYLINELLESANNKKNCTLQDILNEYEWYFVPILNPDGYEFAHTKDRLWRKNRNRFGVDLNRNFDASFGTGDASWNQHHSYYCGRHAFSESETYAFAKFVEQNSYKLLHYISIHSWNGPQFIQIPYGHGKEREDNYWEVRWKAESAAENNPFKSVNKSSYTIGNNFETLGGITSGDSISWVKMNFKVPYVISITMRESDDGHIKDTCAEILGILVDFLTPRRKLVKLGEPIARTDDLLRKIVRLPTTIASNSNLLTMAIIILAVVFVALVVCLFFTGYHK